MFRHCNAQRPRHILYKKVVQLSYYIIRNGHNMRTKVGIVVYVVNLSETATNPSIFCIRLIKISILYPFPVVLAKSFCLFSMARG